MKSIKALLAIIYTMLSAVMLVGQNPIWTLPDQSLVTGSNVLNALPIPDPTETDQAESYTGAQAENSHAAYSDANGELLFFSVDEYFYDKNGYGLTYLSQGSFVSN